jgi:hypothetical protein
MASDVRNQDFDTSPQPASGLDGWRAAKQMLDLHPEGSNLAAVQRADKVLEMGDKK